jgi:predicted O-methyltransferase YrrM
MPKVLTHLIKYRFGLDDAQTQTTQNERDCITRHAAGKSRAVEIGVFEGVTTGVIASALPEHAELFGVDPFIAGRAGICWGKSIATKEAYRLKPRCHIRFVEEFSHEASQKIDGTFDLVFIDGDHSLEGIIQDWNDWSARVDANGIIALHDTLVPAHNPNVANLGSHRYFQDHIQHDDRFEIVERVDSLSVLRRK